MEIVKKHPTDRMKDIVQGLWAYRILWNVNMEKWFGVL